jgi:hypothetical protein
MAAANGSRQDRLAETFFATIGYAPHREQLRFHQSQARFRIPVCGRRFGKSTMAARDLEPKLFQQKKRYWIVGPTYDLAEKEFRVIWDDLIVGKALGKDKRVKKAYSKRVGDMYIEFPWQTRLEVRSADHPEFLVGEALDGVIMSEAAKQKKDTWERFIRPSLADKRGFADFPTTPEGFNWLYDEWRHGQDPSFGDYESWKFPSWANRVVYPEGRDDPEILLLERTLTPEYFAQEIGADFASFIGKIFPEWDEQTHVTSVPFDPALPNYIAFDWGYTNPLAAIEFQVTPRDQIRVWREHYKSYTLLADHVQILKNRRQPEGYHLDLAFGDAADPEAAAFISRELIPCWADTKAKENWREGIDLMRSFMKQDLETNILDEYGTPEYTARFVVDHSCPTFIKETSNYRSMEPIKGKNVPEVGQKASDHGPDAMRYALMHLFRLGATHHLSDVYRPTNAVSADLWPRVVTAASSPVSDGGFFTMGERF